MKRLLPILALFAGLATAQPIHHLITPACKTIGLLNICSEIQPDAVHIGIQNFETQSDYLPATGYWAEGRIKTTSGSYVGFKVQINRDNWTGFNYFVVNIPAGQTAESVDKLTIIQLRSEDAQIVY